ncbi:response regulator [Cohnella rhizosphaerae]|uniref:Response regulator n=1 Tax=Cohnella rhizosphaerae TaxID=1457232 RepID=A0A9X4QU21_9BACL|nr:response regulator [Cohnella rhizosphaerae]MDG0811285.1 response regulator [Cohnella rhizosphaerae]
MNILIADDEPKVRRGLAGIIERSGDSHWQVVGLAHDGLSALSAAAREQVDVLLIDIQMPGLSGLEVIERIRREDPDMTIVIISGFAEFAYAQQALRMGIFDYILKPVNAAKVIDTLRRAEAIAAARHDQFAGLRDKFLLDLLLETEPYSAEAIAAGTRRWGLPSGRFRLMAVQSPADAPPPSLRRDGPLGGRLGAAPILAAFRLSFGLNVFLYPAPADEAAACEADIGAEQAVRRTFGAVRIAFGDVFDDWARLPDAYRAALWRLKGDAAAGEEAPLPEPGEADGYSAIVSQAIRYIREHYGRALRLEEISRAAYVHPHYLSELFKKETGRNLSEYLTDYRIGQAKRMLRDISNKVYMIAHAVGFNDPKYFGQVFKKKVGMSPAEYRDRVFLQPEPVGREGGPV